LAFWLRYRDDVVLTFFATEDVVEMLVSNSPDFADAAWDPPANTLDWHISPTPEGTAFVYARFRDEAGNVSEIAVDGILA
jgi:hypothetical protein